MILGDGAVGKLLVLSQVVLSMQLPFAIYPLLKLTSDKTLMGEFATGLISKIIAWSIFVLIAGLNAWLIIEFFK